MSVKLIVDSACDIPCDDVVSHGAAFLPMRVRMGEQEFLDGLDLTHDEFYARLERGKEMASTSQIAPGFFEEAFKRALTKDDEVVCLTISSRLSGTFGGALMGREQLPLMQRHRVHVVDSFNVSIGEQVLVRLAMRLVGQGAGAAEIVEELNVRKQDVRVFALLDTLEYLRRGGRISAAGAAAGTLLNVKPIVSVEAGAIATAGKARGVKAGRSQMAKLVEQTGCIDLGLPFVAAYSGTCDEGLREFVTSNAELFGMDGALGDDVLSGLPVSGIGATIGTHVGPGAIGVAYFARG